MRYNNIFYNRYIIIDNIKTIVREYKIGVQTNIHKLLYPISIDNNNTVQETIKTIILLIPIIPGGMIGLYYYKKKIQIQYNKYYTQQGFKTHINKIYGWMI